MEPLIIRGRIITSEDIDLIRFLINKYRRYGRTFISRKLSDHWGWVQVNGRLKDRACRDILSALDRRRIIDLPSSMKRLTETNSAQFPSQSVIPIETTLIEGTVNDFRPFTIKLVSQTPLETQWNHLMKKYHYLGYSVLVGTYLKYLVFSNERIVAATGWSSAVWKLSSRDDAIGWTVEQRNKYLHRVANNTRFLIFPWVRIKNLSSHILSQTIRVLNSAWLKVYGYRLWLLETFIDSNRFTGSSYKAANWIHVGQTKGFRKQGNSFEFHNQPKEVYLYPLCREFRKKIGCEAGDLPSLDHRYFLSLEQPAQKGGKRMILQHAKWDRQVLPPFDLSEEDIDAITDEFKDFHALFNNAFKRIEQIELSQCYIQGLMSPIERKSMEPIAINLMDTHRVRSLQHFVSSGVWWLDRLAQRHEEETAKTVADPSGVLSVDSSEFPKKGKDSVGVARQYCGRLGKTENCQSGVFIGYSSPKGYVLLDRQLFLPEKWFTKDYEERWTKCKIPDDITMVNKICASDHFPAKWITCDTIFGNSPDFINNLPEELFYLAEVPSTTHVWRSRPQTHVPAYSGKGKRPTKTKLKDGEPKSEEIKKIAKDPSLEWETVILDEGAKGPIEAKITRLRVVESRDGLPDKECWLFLRSCPDTGEIKYCLSNAPVDIHIDEMTRVCILRWPIEQCFKEGKSKIGMGDYEHRSWEAWHRHMTFVFIAQLFLLRLRHKFKKKPRL
ncbi:MAG: IS701 family transposase [Deltaproteobacteria bacterium]|nr:IS701 family transposase [Deltaproteobacteria bacterium]